VALAADPSQDGEIVHPVSTVRIELLGRFRVCCEGLEVAEGDWPTRRARELVELLALADGRRLLRDQVVEQLWPHLGAGAGAANLRKAAHHARRALGDPEAVVLRSGRVELFPARPVTVDVDAFLCDAELALREGDGNACAKVAAACPGGLLPGAPYEAWTQEARRRVQARLAELLRRGGAWERLMEVEPTDEAACRELMRAAIGAGQRHVAIRAFECLRIAMARELGAQPGAETRALYDDCTTGVRPGERVFVGREEDLARAALQLGPLGASEIAELVALASVDPTPISALTTLAVAEDELDLASVRALTGLGESDVFALLDAALASGVLVVAGTRYRFRHDLVRRALIRLLIEEPDHHAGA